MKLPVKQIIILISISTLLGFLRFLLLDNPDFTLIKIERELKTGLMEKYKDFEIPDMLTEPMLVNSEIAFNLFSTNRALLIDARDNEEFQIKHIKNAINIPYDYYEEYQNVIDSLDMDFAYIVYCSGGECSLSLDLADYLFEYGFFNMFVYEGGLPEWEENGYPVE